MKKKNLLIPLFLFISILLNAQTFTVDTISKTGGLDDRINLVFLSDGYQEDELDKFIEDVQWMLDAILAKEPYVGYKDYFNAFAIRVPSEVSGAANDPDSLINNYFGSTFNWANIWRLVVPAHSGKVQAVLRDNFPEYDQAFMVVNDSRYGGSGGWIATSTTHTNGPEICIHEMGHSFASLRDEYWAGPQYAREGINMTQESDPEKVKWSRWIPFRGTGIYAHSESPTWYRPHQSCEMRYLNQNFCPVCQEAIASKILDLTSPVISFSPAETSFEFTDDSLNFRVDLLKPDPNSIRTSWLFNGDSLTQNVDSISIKSSQFVTGTNRVSLQILDTTAFIRDSRHSEVHSTLIEWFIDYQSTSLLDIQKSKVNISLYPNPVSTQLTVEFNLMESGPYEIHLITGSGKKHQLDAQLMSPSGDFSKTYDLSGYHLSPGNYFVFANFRNHRISMPLTIL